MNRPAFCVLTAVLALAIWIPGGHALAAENLVKIQAGEMSAVYDKAKGTFSLQRRGKTFVSRATFGNFFPPGEVKVGTRQGSADDGQSPSQVIDMSHPSGRTASLILREGRPLVYIHTHFHGPITVSSVTPLSARIELGAPAKELRALGYDGLAPADRPKTTYMAVSVANPKTRAGVVCGWVTHDRASGIAISRPDGDGVLLEGRAEFGRLLVLPGMFADGGLLAIGYFDDALDGLEQYADWIAKVNSIKVRKVPSGYMTWYHARALDEKRMPVLAKWCDDNLKRYGLDFMQIDDGWQLANRDFTSYDPKGAYPGGMKPTAEAIKRHGFMPGIWLTPFGWDHKRPVFAGHQNWFVKRADGSVYSVEWGGDCLDMSNPDARQFLSGVVGRMSRDWGYQFFKLDGLWAGLAAKILYGDPSYRPDGFGDAVFYNRMTNIEAFRTGLETVREAAGPDAYFLGCTASQNMRTLAGSVGLVNGMRVGVDSNKSWEGLLMNVNVATSIYYLHGRVWHNDPDVLYLDKEFTLDHVRTWASWLAVTGQLYMVSAWLPEVPAERIEIVKRTIPNHNLKPRPVDLYESYPARVWHLRSGEGDARRDIVAFFNWADKVAEISVPLERLGIARGDYAVFDYWNDKLEYSQSDTIRATIGPKSCRVFSVRQAAGHPLVVSTSRHVTQGIIDLAEEKWDAATRTLSGVSRVVGGDHYEIRTAAPGVRLPWEASGAVVSAPDEQAGVTIRIGVGKPGVDPRVVIQSPANREVRWTIRYTPALIDSPLPKRDER